MCLSRNLKGANQANKLDVHIKRSLISLQSLVFVILLLEETALIKQFTCLLKAFFSRNDPFEAKLLTCAIILRTSPLLRNYVGC